MANEEHLAILRQGVEVWNKWRDESPHIEPDLSYCILEPFSDLRNVNFSKANLENTSMSGMNLSGANLTKAYLFGANIQQSNLMYANLQGAILACADLDMADLSDANLCEASLMEANLPGVTLIRANLSKADLTATNLISADLSEADLSDCSVFGVSAWNINIHGAKQANLTITRDDEPQVTVDNLEVAQFVYLLLHNEKLRDVIDTLTTKSVLILGRFSSERKAVLDAMREKLRERGYVPLLFDFEKPANRDLTETVMTLASLSRFVIADLSDPNSIPHELMSFAEKLLSVPVKPVFCPTKEHPKPYPMLEHLQRYPHVLPTYFYDTEENLIAALAQEVIEPAEAKVKAMGPGNLA